MKAPSLLLFSLLLLSIFACNKENVEEFKETEVERNDEFEVKLEADAGMIGLTFDTREIVRKKQNAETITLTFNDAQFSDLNETKIIDPISQMTVFSWAADELNDSQKAALVQGTSIAIAVESDGSNVLIRNESTAIFDQQNRSLSLGGELPEPRVRPFAISGNVKYYLQNRATGKVWSYDADGQRDKTTFFMTDFESGNNFQEFTINPVGGAKYELLVDRMRAGGQSEILPVLHNVLPTGNFFSVGGASPDPTSTNDFSIIVREDGYVNVVSDNGYYVQGFTTDDGIRALNREDAKDITLAQWRMIAANIDWTIDDLGSRYSQPVLPAVDMQFAYQEEIRNCSGAAVSASVGTERTQTFSRTVTREESLQLYSSSSATQTYSAEVTISGEFYGVGASTTASTSFEHTLENSITKSTTTSDSETETEEIRISLSRTIDVPARTSVRAYDVVQFYDEIAVPYVQHVRIKGRNRDNFEPLSGAAIEDQLWSQFFDGVITAVGPDFVEVTIRGVATFDLWSDVKREIEDGTPCE
ncbi:MAG: hypothetical protein AAGI23_06540 [Bacteroidota bacterium]